ncbi:MAG: hypothetical protein ABI841_07190, partial [Chloroflexota bacterium]
HVVDHRQPGRPLSRDALDMSVREAGRKGGTTTRARYGAEFFQEIGAKGGKAVSERYSNEHFREIGRKGGRRVAELIARAKRLDDEGR